MSAQAAEILELKRQHDQMQRPLAEYFTAEALCLVHVLLAR
jgi:hypothetical protein